MFRFTRWECFEKTSHAVFRLTGTGAVILLCWGLWLTLFDSPPDWRQVETVRILYIHFPTSWLALFTFISMGIIAIPAIFRKSFSANLYIRAIAPLGAGFTMISVITGSFLGQPEWRVWWAWDVRLSFLLTLFFLYMAVVFLHRRNKDAAALWFSLGGLIALPAIRSCIIWGDQHFRVRGIKSLAAIVEPALYRAALEPLAVMSGAFICLLVALALFRYESERRTHD